MDVESKETGGTALPEIRRVAVGVDGSEQALHAALWAAREARSRGVPLLVMHAIDLPMTEVPPIEPADYAERAQRAGGELVTAAAAEIARAHPDVAVAAETSLHAPVARLTELSEGAELIVTGTRGRGAIAGTLLGSVSRALAAHAPGPLVVVRGPEPESADGAVVLGLGANPCGSAIEYAFDAAHRYGSRLRVVRSWTPPMPLAGLGLPGASTIGLGGLGAFTGPQAQDSESDEAADAERAIGAVRARYQDVDTEIVAPVGDAVPVLTEVAAGARLIVVGAHRHRGPFTLGAGYVVDGLLSHSPVPVAIVR
ncbi:MAG TPA: universal stress protein [Actinospica sp.]|nr:universal stress protein [Actinospica sp.]